MSARERLRLLPAIGRLLDDPVLGSVQELYGRERVRVQARRQLDRLRREIDASTSDLEVRRSIGELPLRIRLAVEADVGQKLRRVINATGIFVHTNLGRSPLPREIAEEVVSLLSGYCDLELELEHGKRSDRNRRASSLLSALVGAEAGLVTNNNAAAMVLALSTFAKGRSVLVSRGELVEIGGSFRIPSILEAAGARLVEVGTTNRTRVDDYRHAVDGETALLLKVHPSNYRIRGFTESTSAEELVALGREHDLPVLVDEGSGLLRQSPHPQLRDHDSMEQLVAAGVDLVCGSGDKVLGGPQAGLLVGRSDLIGHCRKNPLYRALRPDRFAYAALEAVLRRHLSGRPMPIEELWNTDQPLRDRLVRLQENVGGEIIETSAYIGGGSAPDARIPGPALALVDEDSLLVPLRRGGTAGSATTNDEPTLPVMAYARDGNLVLDLRTVLPEDDEHVARAIARARKSQPATGSEGNGDTAAQNRNERGSP